MSCFRCVVAPTRIEPRVACALVHYHGCDRISITLVTRRAHRQNTMPLQELAKSTKVRLIARSPVRVDLCDVLDQGLRMPTAIECIRGKFDDLG